MPKPLALPWLLAAAVGTSFLVAPAQAQEPPGRRPVFFAPLTVDKPIGANERLLRETLSTALVGTGGFSEVVSVETERVWQDCVRTVNQDATSETCWVRLGHGQGAKLLVSGEVRGSAQRCTVLLRVTVLETRTTEQKHMSVLEPCSVAALQAGMASAAQALAAGSGDSGEETPAQPVAAGQGRLVLRSTPLGATAWLGTSELGRCGSRGLQVALPPGGHKIRFQLTGHQEKSIEARVVEGEEREVSVALLSLTEARTGALDASGQPGVLTVRSTPPRARILLDGQDTAKVTDANLTLPPGRYVLRLTKELYLPGQERTVDVQAGDMVIHTETLTPNFGTLRVSSTPPGAEVLLNGQSAGVTPLDRPQQEAGHLRVTLRYPQHVELIREVDLKQGGQVELSETLTPAYGRFEVTSTPPGAELLVDGRSRGVTPVTLDKLPQGRHRLLLRLDLHDPAEATLDVEPGEVRSLGYELRPNFGTLVVADPGQAARVWLDDRDLGAPGTFRVGPGPHGLEVRPQDARYAPHRESVRVVVGRTLSVTPVLAPRLGGLLVTTEPAGAQVFVDGRPQRGEPLKLDSLLIGAHALRAEKDGFSPVEHRVEVVEGKRQTVMLRLSTKGSIRVASEPPGATVVVQGKPPGPAPLLLGALDEGRYIVRCELDGHLPQEHAVSVRDGEVERVVCHMVTRNFYAEARTSKRRWGTASLVAGLLVAGGGGYALYRAAQAADVADERYDEYHAETKAARLDDAYARVDGAVSNQRAYAALGWGGLGVAAALVAFSIYEFASVPRAARSGSGGDQLVPLLQAGEDRVVFGMGGRF